MPKSYAVKLSEAERDHLLTLLRDSEVEGSYYGNAEHYRARTARLIERLSCNAWVKKEGLNK